MTLNLPDALTPLERSVLTLLLQQPGEPFASAAAQFSLASVTSREFTGAGGYTNFTVPAGAPFYAGLPNAELAGVWATHPQINAGAFFLLFIRDGCVAFLEFVAGDGLWPADESLFTLIFQPNPISPPMQSPAPMLKNQLRPATNQDQAALERLIFGVLREYGLAPDPDGTDADLRDIDAHYQRGGGAFDVLLDGEGNVIGSVALFAVSPSTCELRKMYLAHSARGFGLGRRLLEHALAKAAALGFTRMVLETASVLREAVCLYERYGFRPYTPKHLVPRCDAAYYLELPSTHSL